MLTQYCHLFEQTSTYLILLNYSKLERGSVASGL